MCREPCLWIQHGQPVVDDAKVSVSGPGDQVSQVAQVTATINVDGLTDSVDQSVHLVARHDKGELVDGVTLTPSLTGIRIDIQQTKFSRSMAISPQITGAPRRRLQRRLGEREPAGHHSARRTGADQLAPPSAQRS